MVKLKEMKALAQYVQGRISPYCSRTKIAGSIRRKKAEPKDIDIICVPTDRGGVLKQMRTMDDGKIIRKGEKVISATVRGINTDVYFTDKKHFGAMLLFLTGPSGANIGLRVKAKRKGMKLNQYGLWKDGKLVASKTERSILHALSHPYKPPELRGKPRKK